MTVLLVLIVVAATTSVWLCVDMSRRDRPHLGLVALVVLVLDGIIGTLYGALASA